MVSGFLSCFELKSALAELRSAAGGLEAVFSFFDLIRLYHKLIRLSIVTGAESELSAKRFNVFIIKDLSDSVPDSLP